MRRIVPSMRRMGVRWRSRRAARAARATRATRVRLRPPARTPERVPAELGRGLVAYGTVWLGGDTEPFRGFVVIDDRGVVDYAGPFDSARVPSQLPLIGGRDAWIGPGIVDAHVHLGFGDVDRCLRLGLVGVRDLGAPTRDAREWRTGPGRPTGTRPVVVAAGPIITAPGGYPSQSWGSAGYAAFAPTPAAARKVVRELAAGGADLIKVALESGDGAWPVLDAAVLGTVVTCAHEVGLAVVAHALTVDTVRLALAAGVDELAHTPTELLPEELIEALAAAGMTVVSTLQTFFATGLGRAAAANAAALHRAGVVLRYGTDLGNAGTRPGVDPRELDRLADTGLGRLGALRAATVVSAAAPGMRARTGLIQSGTSAALVVLSGDPLAEPGVWRAPTAVIADGRLLANTES
jgi:imidazolonepropionase-like amidohydrolase